MPSPCVYVWVMSLSGTYCELIIVVLLPYSQNLVSYYPAQCAVSHGALALSVYCIVLLCVIIIIGPLLLSQPSPACETCREQEPLFQGRQAGPGRGRVAGLSRTDTQPPSWTLPAAEEEGGGDWRKRGPNTLTLPHQPSPTPTPTY